MYSYFYPNMKAVRAVVEIKGYFFYPLRRKFIYSIIYYGNFW
jgi:hypothetical protein